MIKIIEHASDAYREMVDLRYELLRKPLGLNFSPDDLLKEENDVFFGYFSANVLAGCCSLSPIDSKNSRLRQMAVRRSHQHQGIGTSLLQFAESYAIQHNIHSILIHAREEAVSFYEKNGYKKEGRPFEEIGITHFLLEKYL